MAEPSHQWSNWLTWFTPILKLADPGLNPAWGSIYLDEFMSPVSLVFHTIEIDLNYTVDSVSL